VSPADSPTARQKAAGKTQDRLVEAARALFHERGFEAVTTEEIAAAAGVAKGTLFLHAHTKERLLVLVYEQELAAASQQAFARLGAGLPLPAALARVFGRFFRLYEGAPDLARRFVKEALFLRPEEAPRLEQVRQAFVGRLVALLADRQAQGEIASDVDVPLAAINSFLLYYGVLTGWLSGVFPDGRARDQALAASLALHCRGLAAAPSTRRRS